MIFTKIKRRLCREVSNVWNRCAFRLARVQFGPGCAFNGIVCAEGTRNIRIGSHVRINSGKHYNRIGGDTRTLLKTMGPEGAIQIGDRCGISNSTIIAAAPVVLEDGALLGGGCKLYTTDFHPIDPGDRAHNRDESTRRGPITIGANAFIGAHAIILKGVRVGRNSVVGAGSVVAKDIPDNEVWAGNPARFIRSLSE